MSSGWGIAIILRLTFVHVYVCWDIKQAVLCICSYAGKGCDEGCDGGPTADQQREDSVGLGSSEHAELSPGNVPPVVVPVFL